MTVALTLKLIKIPERKIVAQQRVIRQQPAAGTTIPDIVNAFNAALSGTVEEAVRWAVGIPALLSSRPSVS